MTVQIARAEERFKSPGPQPNGLHAADDGLWYIDQVDLKVYKLDYQTGEILFEAQTDTEHSSGSTFGNGSLWGSSTFELKIAELDPATATFSHCAATLRFHASPCRVRTSASASGSRSRSASGQRHHRSRPRPRRQRRRVRAPSA